MSPTESSSDRIARLEELVMHLQRDLDQLNTALVDQQRQLDGLRRLVETVDDRVSRMTPQDDKFDPVDERPPHY